MAIVADQDEPPLCSNESNAFSDPHPRRFSSNPSPGLNADAFTIEEVKWLDDRFRLVQVPKSLIRRAPSMGY